VVRPDLERVKGLRVLCNLCISLVERLAQEGCIPYDDRVALTDGLNAIYLYLREIESKLEQGKVEG